MKKKDWMEYDNIFNPDKYYVDKNYNYEITIKELEYMNKTVYSNEQYDLNTDKEKVEKLKNLLSYNEKLEYTVNKIKHKLNICKKKYIIQLL